MKNKLENVFIKVGDATPKKIKYYFESRGVDTSYLKCESTSTEDCYGVLDGVFSLYYADSRKAQGGIFVIPIDTEGTFIKCGTATPEQIRKYFASSGIETHPYDLKFTDPNHCYGVFDDKFGIFRVKYVSKFDAEFITIDEDKKPKHPMHNKFIVCGTATQEQLKEYFGKSGIHSSLTFSVDNNRFCYGFYDNSIVLLEVESAKRGGGEFITIEEDKKPKQSTYYYLMTENGVKAMIKHLSIESARKEAEKILLVGASIKRVEILQCVEVWKSEKKVSSESLVEGGKGE